LKLEELWRELERERPTPKEFSLWEKEIVAKGELLKALEHGLLFMRSFIWALVASGIPISKKEECKWTPSRDNLK